MEKKSRLIRAQQEKDKMEVEQAVALSQMPKVLKKSRGAHAEPRSVEEFMDDQIKYEQKRYENLKNAIVKEEATEVGLFQPAISKNSVKILEKKGITSTLDLLQNDTSNSFKKSKRAL